MSYGKQQKEEIKTVRGRNFVLELSDADVERLFKKSGIIGYSVEKLIVSFIGDLIGGTYSNGSDERDYAEAWYRRCGFEYMAEETFLRYLIEMDCVEDTVDDWGDLKDKEKDFWEYSQSAECNPEVLEDMQMDLKERREQMQYLFEKYRKCYKYAQESTIEEGMGKVLEWQERLDKFLGK